MDTDLRDQDKKSVFDFLYCDSRRVTSFLAQFNPSGNLTGHRKMVSQVDKSGSDSSAGVDLKFVKGAIGGNKSAETTEQSEETYDPFWASAVSLLGHLEREGLLKKDLHAAMVGHLVLVSGDLQLVDLRVVKGILNSPVLAKRFGLGDSAKMTPEQLAENELTLEFVKIMPHTVQVEIRCPADESKKFSAAWMTLDPTAMVVPPDDILMKYGHKIGRWKMLAIKDAALDNGSEPDAGLVQLLSTKNFGLAAEERHTTSLALIAEFCAPLARKAMGRPKLFYGVTPIMIFREVAKDG